MAGATRRAWLIFSVAALMTLLAAAGLEYVLREELREFHRLPLGVIDAAAARDLTTAYSAQMLDPWQWPERIEAVAHKHPDSPVAPYALWLAHIALVDEQQQVELALRAAFISSPDDGRYGVYVRSAARALTRAERRDEAVALVEDALQKAGPEHREMLEAALEHASGDDGDGH